MPFEFTIGVVSFLVFALVKVTVFRLRAVETRFALILRALLGAALLDASIVSLAPPGFDPILDTTVGRIAAALVSLCILAGLFIAYMPFYYVIAASVSIRTLILIESAPLGAADVTRFASVEPLRRMLEHRLASMVRSGNLLRDGAGFRLTAKGAILARIARGLKRLWRLGPGG